MEEQAGLVNRHDFNLIVVLDAVVDIHQGQAGSPRQQRDEKQQPQVVCPLLSVFKHAAAAFHKQI